MTRTIAIGGVAVVVAVLAATAYVASSPGILLIGTGLALAAALAATLTSRRRR